MSDSQSSLLSVLLPFPKNFDDSCFNVEQQLKVAINL